MDAEPPAEEPPADSPVEDTVVEDPPAEESSVGSPLIESEPKAVVAPQIDSQISLSEMRLRDEINRVIGEVKMSRILLIILVILNGITFLLHLSKMMTGRISFPQGRRLSLRR